MADVSTLNQGTVVLFTLNTDAARQFVKSAEVQIEPWQRLDDSSFGVEHGYAAPLIEGMRAEGLIVE